MPRHSPNALQRLITKLSCTGTNPAHDVSAIYSRLDYGSFHHVHHPRTMKPGSPNRNFSDNIIFTITKSARPGTCGPPPQIRHRTLPGKEVATCWKFLFPWFGWWVSERTLRPDSVHFAPSPPFHDWWRWTGSNRRPPACKAGALPTELHPL